MSDAVNCEYCVNYSYDDDYECYTCEVNLDEDEMVKFITEISTSAHILKWATNIVSCVNRCKNYKNFPFCKMRLCIIIG